MLEYVASREHNAYLFLYKFFTRVITDSGIMRFFDEYENACKACGFRSPQVKQAKAVLYDKYNRFIAANTPTKSVLDTTRMLHKVLNVFAYTKMIPGSDSKMLDWNDLMYNKVNWRDKDKLKTLTREEASLQEIDDINANFFIEYQVNKAIRNVKKQQGDISEVRDELAQGVATVVHHIFPKSEFPEIATYYENLILLTSSQHYQKAHPRNNTHLVDRDYQLTCLMAKSKTIENSIIAGDTFYKKESFVFVINTGLEENIETSITFDNIRKFLVQRYLQF